MNMQERNTNTSPLEQLLAIPEIASISAAFYDAVTYHAELSELDLSDEENRHALYYAENGLKEARAELLETICQMAFSGDLTFDQTVDLLRHFGFDHSDTSEADYESLVARFSEGSEILLKQSFHYPQDVRGVIASGAMLAPFIDADGNFHPVIYIEVTGDDLTEGEIVPIRTSRRTGERSTPTVVVGTTEIDAYLARTDDQSR